MCNIIPFEKSFVDYLDPKYFDQVPTAYKRNIFFGVIHKKKKMVCKYPVSFRILSFRREKSAFGVLVYTVGFVLKEK